MTALQRWNPFRSMARFDPVSDFEDLIRGSGLRPLLRESEVAPELRMDVAEDDKAYIVKAEIPGVEKKDIDVSIEGNQVAISAEVRREAGERARNWSTPSATTVASIARSRCPAKSTRPRPMPPMTRACSR
jgi:HSP20 family protein